MTTNSYEHYNKVKPGVLCLIVGGRKGTPNIGKQVEAVRRVCHGEDIDRWVVNIEDDSPVWLVKGNPTVKTLALPVHSSPYYGKLTLEGEVVTLVKERHLLPITPPTPRLQVTSIKKLKVPSDATEFDVV